MKAELSPASSVDEVLELYRTFGGDNYDELVTQLDHALQCADHASSEGAERELVAASLLHDVGHLLDLAGLVAHDAGNRGSGNRGSSDGGSRKGDSDDGDGDVDLRHELSGARYLSGLFPAAVTAPIALHVRAKRYLCATDDGYLASLSEGSRLSLQRQGGPMSAEEVASFEGNPGSADAVRLRRWDDTGKVEGRHTPDLDFYTDLLRDLCR